MAGKVTTCKGESLKSEKFEVIFKRYHVTHFPWGKNDENVPLLGGFREVPFQNVTIEVTRLCHVTHNAEAELINQHDAFVFKPKKKLGKPSSTNRETLVICDPTDRAPNNKTKYRQISESEEVLPGCYVWWSIDNSCFPAKEHNDPYLHQPSYSHYNATNDFTIPYQSCFGNKKFSVDFNELLQCYQEACMTRFSRFLPRLAFRCGGTQRYNRQICKVIIVCPEYCLSDREYPQYYTSEMWFTYGRDGKVQVNGTLKLTIQNGVMETIKCGRSSYYSWDTYAFAFYFPSEQHTLECPKVLHCSPGYATSSFKLEEVRHNISPVPCFRKEKPPGRRNFLCPNEIVRPEKRKRNDSPSDDEPERKKFQPFQ